MFSDKWCYTSNRRWVIQDKSSSRIRNLKIHQPDRMTAKAKIPAFWLNNRKKYISKQLQNWAKEKNIKWEFIIQYNSHENGVIDQAN